MKESKDDNQQVARPLIEAKKKYARIFIVNKYPLPSGDTDPLNAIAMYARYGMMLLRFGKTNGGYTALSNILCELSRISATNDDNGERIKVDCEQMSKYDLEDNEVVQLHRSMLCPKESLVLKMEEVTTNKNKEQDERE